MSSIKPDPTVLEEQDDLLMSYLNSDYLSTDNSHWPAVDASTPESTSSSEQTHVISPSTSPETACNESFEITQKDDQVNWPLPNYMLSESLHQGGCLEPDLLSGFPFFIQNQQQQQQQHQNQHQNQHQQSLLSTATVLGSNVVYSTPVRSQVLHTQPSSPVSLSSCSSVENEQLKRKRGRRKHDSSANASPVITSSLALAPAPQGLKSLATIRPAASLQSPVKFETATAACTNVNTGQSPNDKSTSADDQKVVAMAKRQERLIKNRAAALLSRKRKREHLTALEEQKKDLLLENEKLLKRLESLENEKNILNTENQELKNKLSIYESKHKVTPMSSMVLMIILFSFAILAFPTKPSRSPLINSSATTFQLGRYCSQTNGCKTKDEPSTDDSPFFIKTVNGKNLEEIVQEDSEETVQLYSDQLVQLHKKKKNVVSKSVSLMCPYEQKTCKEETQRFLQIDMQVVRSRLIHGEFKTQYESDTLFKQQQGIKRRKLNS